MSEENQITAAVKLYEGVATMIEQVKTNGLATPESIDATVDIIEKMARYIKELRFAADSIENHKEDLKKSLKDQILAKGADEAVGVANRFFIKTSKPVVTDQKTPDENLYNRYERFVRMDVKTQYSWDKHAIKRAIKEGETLPFATIGDEKELEFEAMGTKK